MQSATTVSERRACQLVGLSRTVLHYTPVQQPENALIRDRLELLAEARRRFGYRRLHALLRREGVEANHKRVHRIYRDAGLAVRRRRKRHGVAVDREPLEVPTAPNQVWSMDFVFDALASGRRIKCLTVVDDYTREAIDVVADQAIGGAYVTRILDRIATFRGYPAAIRTDQGPEFTGRALDQWAYRHGVQLKLIQAGKPTQNAFIESFNGRFRDECLNDHWFTSLNHARQLIAEWRRDYNEQRPHSSLGYRTPAERAAEHRKGASAATTTIEQ